MSEGQNGQKKMKLYQIIIIVVAALIILGVATFFIIRGTQTKEEIPTIQTVDSADTGTEVTEAVPVTEFQVSADDVVANVDGQPVTGAEVLVSYQNILNYYGEPDAENLELYYSVAMEEAVTLKLINLTAAKMGLDQFTQEELDTLYATSDSEWQYALDNYVTSNLTDSATATEEEKAAAYTAAEAYYSTMGYTKESLRASYKDNAIFERVKNDLCKDVTVSDDEVYAYYNDTVSTDQATYGSDVNAYETQLMMFQYGYAEQEPWYRPAGYRYVKHILLSVDETLMATYTDLLARFEEQMNEAAATDAPAADAAAATVAPDAAATDAAAATAVPPVTQEEIDAAKTAILASVQATIDEINAKLAQGVAFEDLIAQYGTDTGMTDGTYPNGYEVSLSSFGYAPEFISAAFSVSDVGAVSEPYISQYGVHIVKYMSDIPAGPIELTDELKASIHQNLLDSKDNEVLDAWHSAADIQYTGIIRSVDEIQAAETTPEATETTPETTGN